MDNTALLDAFEAVEGPLDGLDRHASRRRHQVSEQIHRAAWALDDHVGSVGHRFGALGIDDGHASNGHPLTGQLAERREGGLVPEKVGLADG